MRYPLHVAFVWHMHQPHYLDEGSGEFLLPWVRLHAVKDYLHMVELLEDYPRIHATFNLVPSLIEQIESYAQGTAVDRAWRLSLRETLTPQEKAYVNSLFFSASRERLIKRYPRYWQLLRMREAAGGDLDLLGDAYWRDLTAWFNLAWIDPSWLRRDPVLSALAAKGSHFSQQDVGTILTKHREIIGATLPAYRRSQRRGQIEVSTSPYYHPILPLLIDSDSAREPSSWLTLPEERFQRPEDARAQLALAIQQYEGHFGRPPAGMWPSEGAVSQGVVDLLAQFPEIRWMATDEAILSASLHTGIDRNGWGYLSDPRFLYQPYWVRSGDHRAAVIFRDHYLSDRVGFTYHGWSGSQGAEDLMFRLASIREMVKDDQEPYLVSIILDGENCWEHYEENGECFLRALYERLSEADWVRTVTVSEFLKEYPPRREIPTLATGSWINGNLETWIGEDTQNQGWNYLRRTREALAKAEAGGAVPEEHVARAWRNMRAAEGSDWFWWYYSHNSSDQDDLFDRLFRQRLAGVYAAIGEPVPGWLSTPIVPRAPKMVSRALVGPISPPVSVDDMSPVHWNRAGFLDPRGSSGTMQQGSAFARRLYFGSDGLSLFLRLESFVSLKGYLVAAYLAPRGEAEPLEGDSLPGQRPADVLPVAGRAAWEVTVAPGSSGLVVSRWQENAGWATMGVESRLAAAEIVLEMGVFLAPLGLGPNSRLGLSLAIFRDGIVVQRLPEDGEIILDIPEQATSE